MYIRRTTDIGCMLGLYLLVDLIEVFRRQIDALGVSQSAYLFACERHREIHVVVIIAQLPPRYQLLLHLVNANVQLGNLDVRDLWPLNMETKRWDM